MATKSNTTSNKKNTSKKTSSTTKKNVVQEVEKEEIKEDKVFLDKTDDIKKFMEGKVEEKPKKIKKHPIVDRKSVV